MGPSCKWQSGPMYLLGGKGRGPDCNMNNLYAFVCTCTCSHHRLRGDSPAALLFPSLLSLQMLINLAALKGLSDRADWKSGSEKENEKWYFRRASREQQQPGRQIAQGALYAKVCRSLFHLEANLPCRCLRNIKTWQFSHLRITNAYQRTHSEASAPGYCYQRFDTHPQ